MLFPISDDNRGITTVAYVTYALLAINVLGFLYQQSNEPFTNGWSAIPKEITTGQDLVETIPVQISENETADLVHTPGPPIIWLTLISSLFLHGDVMHLGGNLLFLWIFGNNVEHRFGHVLFLAFYLLSGIVGTLAQIVVDPGGILPILGASGAIAGVMGAYVVLFPRNKVNAVFFITVVSVPAIFVLGIWGLMQLVSGIGAFGQSNPAGGVAYMAHIGGFVTGLAIAVVMRGILKEEPDSVLRRQYEADPTAKRIW